MIDIGNITYNQRKYYVPQYGSPDMVAVIHVFPDGYVLVDPSTAVKHRRFYSVDPRFLCSSVKEANSLFRQWESTRKIAAKQKRKERNKARRKSGKKK